MSADPISIIIPAHNQLAYCQLCIASIQRKTERPYRLILVDNGSTDGVSEFFDTVPGATVVHSPENRGFAGGVNLGLEHATGHVCLLNSDTIVTPGWLARLEDVLMKDGDTGIVGPMSNHVSGVQLVENLELTSEDEIDAYARQRADEKRAMSFETTRLVGFCMLIRDEVVAKVGRFDESYGIGNFEDDDYCRRTRDAGYTLAVAEDVFIYHFGQRTFQALGFTGESFEALMGQNAQKYADKWGEPLAERYNEVRQAAALHEKALQQAQVGDLQGALQNLVDAVRTDPFFSRGHNDLGAVLWELGERHRAYDAFARAARLCPTSTSARDNLRDAAGALGRMDEAEKILRHSHGH